MIKVNLRNGFGFDAESVDAMPMWCWVEGMDTREDEPLVGVFDGLIFKMPFFSILWGKIYAVGEMED